MKNLRFLILAIFSCLFALFAVACNMIKFDYNIDFVVDGVVVATVGTNGDKISMPKNPSKENFTFDGWYWDDGEWDDKFTLNSILDQPLQEKNHYKVYAKFKSSVYYTVIFDNGDEEITQQIRYGEPTTLRLNTFVHEDENYVFDYWRNGDNEYQDGEEVLNLCEVGETIRLYPNWIVNYGSYEVEFDSNGGSGNMSNQTISRNEHIKLSKNTFTREYFNFIGWNTREDGLGFSYSDEVRVYNLAKKNETITLYAQWKYNDEYASGQPIIGDYYTVRYVDKDGTIVYERATSVDDKVIVHCMLYQTPESYTFVGWNTKASGTGLLYENGTYLDDIEAGETVILYAQYKRIDGESENNIYYIGNYNDLLLMKNDLGGTYVLLQDIDLPNGILANDYECGTQTSPFNGKFFGNGYRIRGSLSARSYEKEIYCGLFGYIGENGWVQDLHLELSIDSLDYGATFARYNKGTIINCSATGQVSMLESEFLSKDLFGGGIVVFNEGTIKNTLSAVFMGGTTIVKNIQMGGICATNNGTIENCIFMRNVDLMGGYKYNEYTSFQIDGLMCVNEGVSTNNYYFDDINYEIANGVYNGGDGNEIYESGKISSQCGTGVSVYQINDKTFYVQTLGWGEEIWDFSYLNFKNSKYPVLKKQ